MAAVPAVIDRGAVARQEFGAVQTHKQAELAIAAVQAREEAIIKAEYLMSERHPRVWSDVRVAMLDHCARPRFSDVARYTKPVGKKKVNGEWIEEKASGFTARFAETLAQEMGNVKPFSHVTYEDDMVRVVRIGVTDLQKNLPRSREVTFAKAVEKRGRQDKRSGEWAPPEGREVISQRVNSYGDPVYLVKATDDELRNKVNSEESKTQRDFILRLCPRDILEECEDRVLSVLASEDKTDPTAARKKIIDRFRETVGLMPSDLEQYIGRPADKWAPADLQELRELGAAIRDGQTTFDEALRTRYNTATEDGEQHGSVKAAEAEADRKIAAGKAAAKQSGSTPEATSTVGAQSKSANGREGSGEQASQGQPEESPKVPTFESWQEIPDQMAASLGLRVVVAGKEYSREATDQTWSAAAKRQAPTFGRGK